MLVHQRVICHGGSSQSPVNQLLIYYPKTTNFLAKKSDVQNFSGLVTAFWKNLQSILGVCWVHTHFDQSTVTTARHGQVLSRENLNFIFQELKQKGGALVFLVFLLLGRGIFGDEMFFGRREWAAKEIEELIRGSVERFVSAKNINKDQPHEISMQVKPRQ